MIALLDHLWQSTLFAGCAWLLAMALRQRSARLRYWVWLAASAKFLIPCSLIAALLTEARGSPDIAQAPLTRELVQLSSPLASPAAEFVPAGIASTVMTLLGVLWLTGSVLLLARWSWRWRLVRQLVRTAAPAPLRAEVPVRMSSTLLEPGVVGIRNPVLLLPRGITDRLSEPEMLAILEHELCHVRRRDNLTAALHMAVEALFWFHPLVWWIGARLVDERERACDEAVLRSGKDPRTYAQGILKVCQFYMASKLACVPGVSGANLKNRLEGIMRNRVINELTLGKKIVLGSLALAALAAPAVVGIAAEAAKSSTAASPFQPVELLAGQRVKLNYENVEVRALLQSLAKAARVNMLIDERISGTVTVRLDEMPWSQALDIVLASQGLARKEQSGVIIVERPVERPAAQGG